MSNDDEHVDIEPLTKIAPSTAQTEALMTLAALYERWVIMHEDVDN